MEEVVLLVGVMLLAVLEWLARVVVSTFIVGKGEVVVLLLQWMLSLPLLVLPLAFFVAYGLLLVGGAELLLLVLLLFRGDMETRGVVVPRGRCCRA